jgi:hypothetical protein
MDSLRVHMWLRMCFAWGIRKLPDHDEETSTSSTPNQVNTTDLSNLRSNWQPPDRTIHIYKNKEESQAARKLRQDTVGELITPMVLLIEKNDS